MLLHQPRLKIAHAVFTRNFWGTERHVAELASEQAERHDVSVFVRADCEQNGRSILDHLSDRVTVIRIPWRFKRLAFRWHLRRLKPDILHLHLSKAAKLARDVSANSSKVLTLHDMELQNYAGMDRYVCISDWQMDVLPPGMHDQAQVIRNWVLPHRRLSESEKQALRDECGVSNGEYIVGVAGRMARIKAPEIAVDGFLQSKLNNAKMLIFGSGELEEWARSLDHPNIRFMGYRSNVKDYLQLFDVFVLASRSEPFGLATLEAMDAGCLVIATDNTGSRDLLASQPDAVLVPTDDAVAIAQALRHASTRRNQKPTYDLSTLSRERHLAEVEAVYQALV